MGDDTGPLETAEIPAAVLPAAHRHRRGPVITRCLLAAVAVLAVTVAAIVAGRVIHAAPAARPAPVRLYDWHLLTERNIAIAEHQFRAAEYRLREEDQECSALRLGLSPDTAREYEARLREARRATRGDRLMRGHAAMAATEVTR